MLDNSGHRQRLREKFIAAGKSALWDHELLELLLCYAIPRRDVKPLAKELLNSFGSFKRVFNAPVDELMSVKGVGRSTAVLLNLIGVLNKEINRVDPPEYFDYENWDKVCDYVRYLCNDFYDEKFCMFLLDGKCRLLTTQCFNGTVSSVNTSLTKLICKAAGLCRAKKVILAHNHPSGNLLPSSADVKSTILLEKCLRKIGITLIDHIIVAGDKCFSMMKEPDEQ